MPVYTVDTNLPVATATTLGGIELGSNTALSETYVTAGAGTADRVYPVQLNSARQAAVSVPWTDTVGAITSVNTTVADQGIAITNPTGANVKVDLDITSMTDDGANLAVTDEFVYHDISASKNFKGTIKNILDLGTQGIVSSISASTAVDEVGIIVTDGATATPEIGFSINSLGLLSSKVEPTDELALVDVSPSPVEQKKVTVSKLTEAHQVATTFVTDISAFGAAVGVTKNGEVEHNLGSYDVIVQLYDVDYKTVYACVDRISTNKVQIDGSEFPASGDIRVLVSKVG